MSKEEYIKLIDTELKHLRKEYHFKIIYLFIVKCKEEGF